jgi:hypothetical protein
VEGEEPYLFWVIRFFIPCNLVFKEIKNLVLAIKALPMSFSSGHFGFLNNTCNVWSCNVSLCVIVKFAKRWLTRRTNFRLYYTPVLRPGRIMWLGMAGGRPHRFLHNNFSSVYRIFTKLGHIFSLSRHVNLVTNPVISREWGKDREEFTTNGTYPWSFVTHIFHNGQPSHGGNLLLYITPVSPAPCVY